MCARPSFALPRIGPGFPAVAGAILGLLPVVLVIVGYGVILGRGATAGTLAAAFGSSMIVFGALLDAGFRKAGRSTAGA